MTRAGAALAVTLAFAVPAADAACLAIVARGDTTPLATIAGADAFRLEYVHSVTRTPVEERYRLDADAITQTGLRFTEHGPGLPTQGDAGHAFVRTADGFVVSMERRFDSIAMRVHADQAPRLLVGARSVDLAAWGNRSLVLSGTRCAQP